MKCVFISYNILQDSKYMLEITWNCYFYFSLTPRSIFFIFAIFFIFLVQYYHKRCNKYIWGPTEIWTRIAGFKVQSANHYTMGPAYWIITCCFLNTTHHAFVFTNQLFSHISRLTASINHKRESVKNIQTGWSLQNIVLFFHRQWNIWIQLTLFWMSCTCT